MLAHPRQSFPLHCSQNFSNSWRKNKTLPSSHEHTWRLTNSLITSGHPNPKSLMSSFCVDNRQLSFRRNWSPLENGQAESQADIVSFGNSTLPLPLCHLSHTQLEIVHCNSRAESNGSLYVIDSLTWFACFVVSQMQNAQVYLEIHSLALPKDAEGFRTIQSYHLRHPIWNFISSFIITIYDISCQKSLYWNACSFFILPPTLYVYGYILHHLA